MKNNVRTVVYFLAIALVLSVILAIISGTDNDVTIMFAKYLLILETITTIIIIFSPAWIAFLIGVYGDAVFTKATNARSGSKLYLLNFVVMLALSILIGIAIPIALTSIFSSKTTQDSIDTFATMAIAAYLVGRFIFSKKK